MTNNIAYKNDLPFKLLVSKLLIPINELLYTKAKETEST